MARSNKLRVRAPKPGTTGIIRKANKKSKNLSSEPSESAKDVTVLPFLKHITDSCVILDLNPSACIPLQSSRPRLDNAVKKLKGIINGDFNNLFGGPNLTGMVSGAPTSVVVPLTGELQPLMISYFQEMFSTQEEVESELKDHPVWYGVIDGCQLLLALLELQSELPGKWGSFQWKVFVVRAGLKLEEYKQLAVVQNERNKLVYHYESTVYEILNSLRNIHDRMQLWYKKDSRSRTQNVLHRDVAQIYDGGDHERNTTIKQAVSIATRLSSPAIRAIGEIANMSFPDMVRCNRNLNTQKLTTTESIMRRYDCRLFKKFVCLSTLRGAALFMNAVKDKEEEAQVNAVYRARHWCEINDYRPIKPHVLNEQFVFAKLALKEEQKFLTFIQEDLWPKDMDTTRDNLLRTTACDKELQINEGNDQDVLPYIWDWYRRIYPAKAKSFGFQSITDNATRTYSDDASEEEPPAIPENDTSIDEDQSTADSKRLEEEGKRRIEDARKQKLRETADVFFSESNIITHLMTFNQFERHVWSPNSSSCSKVDLVTSIIPPGTDNDTIEHLSTICQSVLKTGCYAFFVVSASQFSELHRCFSARDFKVCDHPFSIMYDTSTLKRRKVLDFRQRPADLAIMAKTQGVHQDEFVPDFAWYYSGSAQLNQSIFASLEKVNYRANKLKTPNLNTPIFPDERSVAVFMHAIRLLTPAGGSVLDPLGGALTVSLACLDTGRSCISLGADNNSMRHSMGRLRIFATPDATLDMQEDFTDPITLEECPTLGKKKAHDPSSNKGDTPSTKKIRLSDQDEASIESNYHTPLANPRIHQQ